MFRFNQTHFLRNADAEGSGGADGNDTNTDTNAQDADKAVDAGNTQDTDPAVAEMIKKAVADAVAGLKKKNEELIGKEKRLRDELNGLKAKPTLSEEDFQRFQDLTARIERDELLKDMAEGKSEEVIERVTKRTRQEMEAKLAAEAEARAKREAEANEWKTRYEHTLVENEITRAAAGAVKPEYTEVLSTMLNGRVKVVDGSVRVVNAEGEIEMNGGNPVTVSDLVESLRSKYSALFVASAGGGASGSSKQTAGSTRKISASDIDENYPMSRYAEDRAAGRIA